MAGSRNTFLKAKDQSDLGDDNSANTTPDRALPMTVTASHSRVVVGTHRALADRSRTTANNTHGFHPSTGRSVSPG